MKKVILKLKRNMIFSKNLTNLRKNWKRTCTWTSNIKKIEHPYIELQVQDAETIGIETKKENKEFEDLFSKYKEIDNAAIEQKIQLIL